MGKVNELLQLIEELNRCGNTLIDISEELKNLFSGSEEDSRKTEAKTKTAEKASKEEKTISLEDVRAVMADKSRKGYTAEVKALLTKRGVNKLSDINPKDYAALLAEVGGDCKCRINTQSFLYLPVTGGLPARHQHFFVQRKRISPANLQCRE